jgi:hypothetical protein
VFDVPYINQVYMFYRCDVDKGEYGVGPESLETNLYLEEEIPWEEIAFPVVYETLKEFFVDLRSQTYPVRVSSIDYKPRRA